MEHLLHQIVFLFVLGIPIACIAWTVPLEEVFREFRIYCFRGSKEGKGYGRVNSFTYLDVRIVLIINNFVLFGSN